MLSSLSACGVSPRAASDDGDSHAEGCVCDHWRGGRTEERHTSCASAERDQSVVHRSTGDPGVGENVDGRPRSLFWRETDPGNAVRIARAAAGGVRRFGPGRRVRTE